MKKILITLLMILSSLVVFGQPTLEDDVKLFKRLIDYSEKKNITDSDIKACNRIADTLMTHNCYDYVIKRNDTLFCINGLTLLFGKICERANSRYSIKSYMKYLMANKGSAEEQLAFSFGDIFIKNPELVLNEIEKYSLEKRGLFLDAIAWGINNKEMIKFKNKSKELYKRHKKSMDYIINENSKY